MKSKIILTSFFVLFALSSCITPKQTNFLQDIDQNYQADNVTPVDYKIIPGDQLTLTIYTLDGNMKALFSMFIPNNDELNRQADVTSIGVNQTHMPNNALSVSPSGKIHIPYIGEISVVGMTMLEAKKVVSDRFKEYSTSVTVDITLRNRYFFVLGEMGQKAVRMSNLRMTIFQAIAVSGNISLYGDRKKVKILRQTVDGTEIKTFDIRSQDIVNSDYYYIQPNDVIYVPQVQRKFFGTVTSFTGVFAFVMGMAGTVLGVITLADRFK